MNNTVITILGISFIFLMTTLGSALVFLFKRNVSDKLNSIFSGFSSGIMIAASVWSLILPALSQSESWGKLAFLPVTIGFVLGVIFLVVVEKLATVVEKKNDKPYKKKRFGKSSKLFLAVTLHNIPEGLSVGLAFGNAFIVGTESAFYLALAVAIGIGIQNFPEGSAISLPMHKEFGSRWKAFLFGMLSGLVEPIMAVAGVFLSSLLTPVLPWLLAFSAGSMMYVVAEELMPESKSSMSSIGTWGFIFGFLLMMILDVALG